MTEANWLTATTPTSTLNLLRDKVSNRKLRLFSVACCRRIGRLIYPPWDRVLEAAERFADGIIRDDELRAIRAGTDAVHDATMAVEATSVVDQYPIHNADEAAGYAAQAAAREVVPEYPQNLAAWQAVMECEEIAQCVLLHGIFGNPFHPNAINPSWLTSDVCTLAEGIYGDRAFDRMPILADALQDAGCDNDDVLRHCRSNAQHVRGCWVVDLLTGRK